VEPARSGRRQWLRRRRADATGATSASGSGAFPLGVDQLEWRRRGRVDPTVASVGGRELSAVEIEASLTVTAVSDPMSAGQMLPERNIGIVDQYSTPPDTGLLLGPVRDNDMPDTPVQYEMAYINADNPAGDIPSSKPPISALPRTFTFAMSGPV
jgi:hypothetical protein